MEVVAANHWILEAVEQAACFDAQTWAAAWDVESFDAEQASWAASGLIFHEVLGRLVVAFDYFLAFLAALAASVLKD